MSIRSYRDLEVWQKAMDLVVDCYNVTGQFPRTEIYGLVSQLQRAIVSVPANIAEGHGRSHTREYLNHLSIAYGSLMEAETHLQIAARLRYIDDMSLDALLKKSAGIGRMLNGLIQSLNRKRSREKPTVRNPIIPSRCGFAIRSRDKRFCCRDSIRPELSRGRFRYRYQLVWACNLPWNGHDDTLSQQRQSGPCDLDDVNY
jgi:four helix bundle protein